MGFEVVSRSLRDAAGAAEDAAQQVRGTRVGTAADLAGALPGSSASGRAGELGPHWEQDVETWSDGMDDYGAKLTTAADAWTSGNTMPATLWAVADGDVGRGRAVERRHHR